MLLKALKRASRFLQKVKSFPANIYLFKLSNRCKISDYVIIMSHTCFRVNLHSVVPWMSRNSLLETGADIQNLSGSNMIRIDNHLVSKGRLSHLTKLSSLPVVFCKKGVFRNRPEACNFIKKEALAQLFSCEFYEISKNTFFTEHHRTTARFG